MTLKKYAAPVALFFVLTACYSPKIFLSKDEQTFGDSIAVKYRCEVSMQHDYDAVKQQRKDGEFWIQLKNAQYLNFCAKDSVFLRDFSDHVAEQLSQIMKYKKNYNSVEVVFLETKYPDERTESVVCEKRIVVSMSRFR